MSVVDSIEGFAVMPDPHRERAVRMLVIAAFKTTHVPRAELTMIFHGQTFTGGRAAAWLGSYLFTVAGSKVAFTVPEVWFSTEDLAEFARRLSLPVRGAFSQRVRDIVNESA